MTALYGITLFVSAWLLFTIQPMIAKRLLPDLGGAPVVWNTCMAFFQALLLAGYAYAHASARRFGCANQTRLQLLLLAIPLGLLLGVGSHLDAPAVIQSWVQDAHPLAGLLVVLAVVVGSTVPFATEPAGAAPSGTPAPRPATAPSRRRSAA